MKCSCPKCHTDVELDLPEVSEQGSPATCPECNCRFTVNRESFGGRALRKTGEITCSACGDRLGPYLHCTGCGVLFPDYLVSTVGRKKKRSVQKLQLKVSPFPERKGAAPISLPKLGAPLPKAAKAKKQTAAKAPLQKYGRLLVALVFVVALGAGGSVLYLQQKSRNEFANNMVVAIYCTRIGEKKAVDTCNKIADAWKATPTLTTPPHASPEDLKDLNNLRAKLDGLNGKMDRKHAPKDLQGAMDKLDRLRAVFEKGYSLASSPGGNVTSYTTSTAALDTEYRTAARELKAALPPKSIEKIRKASERYRGLQGFLEL